MMLQFQYPWVLYLLWMVPAAGILWHTLSKRRSMPAATLVSPEMARRLAPVAHPTRRLWQLILFMTGLLLALLAAARPQWGMREETVFQKGRDLMIALDVSRSMLANDVHPSRLGRAKVDLLDLVKQLRGDRVGLIAFRGRPVLLCPLTTDYGFLTQMLEGAGPYSAPRGETSIGDAIQESLKSFESDSGSHRAIVLVSDGEDLAGRVEEALRQAREKNVAIFTVGFGSTDGSQLPVEGDKKGVLLFQGTEVISKLNHELLGDIATRTGGAYVPVGMANVKLGNLYRDHLSRISAREQEESLQRRVIERYQLFLLAAVLCFLAVAYLSRGRIATSVRRRATETPAGVSPAVRDLTPPAAAPRKLALALLLLAAGWGPAHAATNTNATRGETPAWVPAATNVPPGRRGARMAQGLYQRGKYAESAAAYRAAAQSGANRDTWLFNAGCAYLKAGQDEAAADAFRSVGEERKAQGSAAAYNLGVSLARGALAAPSAETAPDPASAEKRLKQLRQAGAAFQQSLKLDPEQQDGRRNLAVTAAAAPGAESQARIARLMAQYQQTPPDQLAGELLQAQRTLLEAIPAAFSNTTPSVIADLEKLAGDQDTNADRLIPLKGKLVQALSQAPSSASASNAPSPQQQLAQLDAFVESLRDRMNNAAEQLRDLDPASSHTAAGVETGVYHLWKGIASYPGLLQEDLRRQTNSIRLSATAPAAHQDETSARVLTEQKEALSLTTLFRERFEQQVPPEGLNAPQAPASTNAADTNAVRQLITPENRARILTLASDCTARQEEAYRALPANVPASLPAQWEAYRLLKEIEKLLPKQEPQTQPQQQPRQQEQPQNQEQQPQPQEKQEPKQEDKQPEERKDQMSKDDARRLLEKARQREKEHEQEKRERDAYIPLSPTERDW